MHIRATLADRFFVFTNTWVHLVLQKTPNTILVVFLGVHKITKFILCRSQALPLPQGRVEVVHDALLGEDHQFGFAVVIAIANCPHSRESLAANCVVVTQKAMETEAS